ncbi:MAG: hypothetical protein IPJ71_18795 [Bdellovibrionales bacterium]|nr:hypothetical protein [Bdellovibrionales bacterium]
MNIGSGSRTVVSEWGLPMARSGERLQMCWRYLAAKSDSSNSSIGEIFLWNESERAFIRVRPYEFTPEEDDVAKSGVGVYTGALNPCDPHLKVNSVCVPVYYEADIFLQK